MKPIIIIGIDCGVHTGLAVWDRRAGYYHTIQTVKLHQAFESVKSYAQAYGSRLLVRVEDARQVRYKTDAEKMKGAGSVCRDAKAWEEFLTDNRIAFEMVRPNKQITNWSAEKFAVHTGYKDRTSTHARDAAMLVYQF